MSRLARDRSNAHTPAWRLGAAAVPTMLDHTPLVRICCAGPDRAIARSADQPMTARETSKFDVSTTWEAAAALEVVPLIVVQGLDPHVPGDGPIEIVALGEGHSNETFKVTRAGQSWVLRRPPRPPFAPRAHDVVREYRI